MRVFLSAWLVAAALAGASASGATDAQSPQGLLKGQVPDNAAALKRVAVTGFVVQYVTDFGVETRRSRGGTFFSKWKNMTPDVMRATADALYVQMVIELKAAGVDVVPGEQVAAHAAMADLRKVARASPATVNDSSIRKASVLVSAHDLPLVLAPVPDAKLDAYATRPIEGTDPPRELLGWDDQASQWLLASNFEMSSLATIYFGQAKVAESLNATALNVRLTVPLVDLGVTTAGNAGGGLFGSAKVTGLVKANARFVEAGTVFSFAQAGGNPGHRHVVGLQKPVPITALKLSANVEKLSLDETIFGRQSARGSGLLGALFRATPAAAASDDADFWISVEAEGFEAALVQGATPIFKELGALLAGAR